MMGNNSTELSENDFETIREKLLKFEGGQVSLIKDETTGIATILLDHPEKRNAMSGLMMVEFRDCVLELEQWKEGKAVILTGKGGNFCSGGDLDFAKATGTPQGGLDMSTWMHDALNRFQRLPLISVCLIHGPSLGGGAELSLSCDYIVAADNVKYGLVHGKMGIVTAWGGGTRLVGKIGYRKALNVMLTSKIMNANECVDVGIAEIVVSSEEALTKTKEWLTPLLQHHHTVIRATKEIAFNASSYSYEKALDLEKFKFAPFWGGEINKEALSKNVKHLKSQPKI